MMTEREWTLEEVPEQEFKCWAVGLFRVHPSPNERKRVSIAIAFTGRDFECQEAFVRFAQNAHGEWKQAGFLPAAFDKPKRIFGLLAVTRALEDEATRRWEYDKSEDQETVLVGPQGFMLRSRRPF